MKVYVCLNDNGARIQKILAQRDDLLLLLDDSAFYALVSKGNKIKMDGKFNLRMFLAITLDYNY